MTDGWFYCFFGFCYGTPRFQPNPQYIREMRRFGIMPSDFDPAHNSIDIFQADRAYWQSFWRAAEQ